MTGRAGFDEPCDPSSIPSGQLLPQGAKGSASKLVVDLESPLLEARDVVKRFGGVAAVDGMSLRVQPGEIVGLIGPNGAGKTTMFDLLAGSQKPTGGAIELAGQPIAGLPAHRRLRLGLGRTFQIPKPFPLMSVVENIMVGAQDQAGESIWPNWFAPGRVARQEQAVHGRAVELLAFMGLDRLAGEPARVLSGGQRKLLELARVMMAEPKLLLLDEPAAGVNPTLLDTIIDRIGAIRDRGVTVFLIEHNMDMVARLCSRVLVMAQGRLLCEGTPKAVVRDPLVIEAYLGGGV